MRDLCAGVVQFESVPGGKAANLATVARFTAQAAAQGVELLCFPECCLTGYWHLRHLNRAQLVALAEPVPGGPSCDAVAELARRHQLTLGAGLLELAPDGRIYNSFVVATPDGARHRHRKLHAFVNPEVSSGDGFCVFDAPCGCRVAVLICYDCNIVENVRIAALMGADVLLAPHQTGGCYSVNPHVMGLVDKQAWARRHEDPAAIDAELRGDKGRGWLLRWLPSRAHDNGLFVLFANGIGVDDDEIRTGCSMILDPFGRIVAETCAAGEALVTADLDASLLDGCTGRRWIRTRRPELYGPLTVPTGAEVETRADLLVEKGILPDAAGRTGRPGAAS